MTIERTVYRGTTNTRPGKVARLTQYHDDGGTTTAEYPVTRAGSIAGWYDDHGTERRFEWEPATMPTLPLWTYDDMHTGSHDNYAVEDGDTLHVFDYHRPPHSTDTLATYDEGFSQTYTRTDMTPAQVRAEHGEDDNWEPNVDLRTPGRTDVFLAADGMFLIVGDAVWETDYDAPVPALPAGWPTHRLPAAREAVPTEPDYAAFGRAVAQAFGPRDEEVNGGDLVDALSELSDRFGTWSN